FGLLHREREGCAAHPRGASLETYYSPGVPERQAAGGARRVTRRAPEAGYDAARAAAYWGGARHETGDELAAVLSLGEPPHVNAAYDAWETGLLLDVIGRADRGLDLGAGVGRVSIRLASRVTRLACGDLAPG